MKNSFEVKSGQSVSNAIKSASQTPAKTSAPSKVDNNKYNYDYYAGKYGTRAGSGTQDQIDYAKAIDISDYVQSGKTNSQTTKSYLAEAQDRVNRNKLSEQTGNNSTAPQDNASSFWLDAANFLNDQLKADYWNEIQTGNDELSKLQESGETLKQNRDNFSRAMSASLKTWEGQDVHTAYDEANKQVLENARQQQELTARQAALQAEMEEAFMTDEVRAAMARLKDNKYITEYGDKDTDTKAADQELVDRWRESLGEAPKFFNFEDRLDAFAESKFLGLSSSLANTAAVGLQWFDQASDDMVRAEYDAEHGEGAYDKAVAGKNVNIVGDAGRKLNEIAMNANEESQADIAKVKQDMSKFGQFGVDLASTALDVGFDAVTGLGLASMSARVFGQSALEAQNRGADLSGQIKYGLANTAIELATEKISDGLGMVYGRGEATDIVEKAIGKLAKTDTGANMLRFFANAGGEGLEEVVSDLLAPFANWIIDEQARDNRTYEIDPSEILYDFLLGAAVGGFGQAAEIRSGEYAAKNAEYKESEQARFDEKLANGEQFTERDVADYNRLESRIKSGRDYKAAQAASGNQVRAKAPDESGKTSSRLEEGGEKLGIMDRIRREVGKLKGNRHTEVTQPVAEKFGALGYTNPDLNSDAAYEAATGITPAEADRRADEASWQAAHAEDTNVSGGDAAREILSNYSDDGLVEIWREGKPLDERITTGDFAEEMTRRGLWTEEQARQFLNDAMKQGAPQSERHRALPNEGSSDRAIFTDNGESGNGSVPANDTKRSSIEKPTVDGTESEASYTESNETSHKRADELIATAKRRQTENGEWDDLIELEERKGSRDTQFNRGKKGSGIRLVSKSTVERMKAATREKPIVLVGATKAMRESGIAGDYVYWYDGSALRRAAIDSDGKIDFDGEAAFAIPSKSFDTQVRILDGLTKSLGMEETSNYAQNIRQALLERMNGGSSAEASSAPNSQVSSEGTPAPATEQKTVKPPAESPEQKTGGGVLATQQESGTITENEGGPKNGSTTSQIPSIQPGGSGGSNEREGQTARAFDPRRTGENPFADKRYVSSTPFFIGRSPKLQTKAWTFAAEHAESNGGHVLTKEEIGHLPTELKRVRDAVEEYFGIPLTFVRNCVNPGFFYAGGSASGIFIDPSHPKFPTVLAHELGHFLWGDKDRSRAAIAKTALVESDLSDDAVNELLANALHLWGYDYMPEASPFGQLGWRMLRPDQQLKELNSAPNRETIIEKLYEELSNVFVTNDLGLLPKSLTSYGNAPNLFVRALLYNEIASAEDIAKINEMLSPFGFQLPEPSDGNLKVVRSEVTGSENYSYYENTAQASKEPETSGAKDARVDTSAPEIANSEPEPATHPGARARSGGVIRDTQSKAEADMATKGERRSTDKDASAINEELGTGDGTFVSRTNEDRSFDARQTIERYGAEVETARLLDEKYSWNDNDVVEAEKLMHDKIMAIRDYMLRRGRRISAEAYSRLKKEYNALVLKHKSEKSRMGQALQAEYAFSDREKIMNRAAKTFLGFSRDGRFTGNTAANTNVKIYQGIEDATHRIEQANKDGNAKALAQVCKDLSDIRGVKKMFGPFSNFASQMENTILDSIAKQENGVAALTTLAYGNANAICDDVQPYKAVNAAKTIRIMNMLSNMSTIVNNVVNNAASGMTSTNGLAQFATRQASKAFENLVGRPVVAKEAKGGLFNKEIRSAEWEALQMATLVQMYGVNQENGRLELNGDKGLFNPNANMFEQTMTLYKFFIGMGVEATDEVKSAGLSKAMQKGIDDLYAAGKISEAQKAEMERETSHEVNRLLYKDDNTFTHLVQNLRNYLNSKVSWGNEDTGTIGLGDITMAFAKVPANVVRARLLATPEGCLFNVVRYANGVQKAKRMHSEVTARGIMEKYAGEKAKLNDELLKAYELDRRTVGNEKDAQIDELKRQLAALDQKCWAEAREQCSGSVYRKLVKERDNYSQSLTFDNACSRLHYDEAKEMSQFDMAQYSRSIGKAASSAGMVVLGAALRAVGALRDFDNEPDEELRKMYAQKGYSGLMLNLSAIGRKDHEWRDGDNIIGADFLEVIALPLAVGACATDSAMLAESGSKGKAFGKTLFTEGLGKAFEAAEDIPGMADAVRFYNAFNNQYNSDNAANGAKLANSLIEYSANSLPSFFIPNAFTQTAAGLDNTVRDVYNSDNIWQQAWNIVKNKGGLAIRSTIPASVDMWGNERRYGENKFWGVVNKSILPGDKLKYRQNAYESEIIRLSKAGYKGAVPKISVSSSFEVDGETYTMDADEKRMYKQNRNTEQAAAYQALMDSDIYKQLDDTQKVAVLKDLKMTCERDAKQSLLLDRGLDVEVSRAKWETELELKDQITYLGKMQMAKAAWDSVEGEISDYAGMDAFIQNQYGSMSDTMKDIADNSLTHLDDLYDAWSKAKIKSEDWQTAYNIYRQYIATDADGKRVYKANLANEAEMWSKMQAATGANSTQMKWYEDNMKLWYQGTPDTDQYYEYLNDAGLSRSQASATIEAMSGLQIMDGYSSVQNGQKYQTIVRTVPKDKQWDAFWTIVPSNASKANVKKMHALQAQGVSLETALANTGMGTYYTKYTDSKGKTHKTKAG